MYCAVDHAVSDRLFLLCFQSTEQLSCGDGVKKSTRTCSKPFPEHGGEGCAGEAVRHDTCSAGICQGETIRVDVCVLYSMLTYCSQCNILYCTGPYIANGLSSM